MVSLESFRSQAMALAGTQESLHFKRVVFGVGKANYATFDPRSGELALRIPHGDPARGTVEAEGLVREVPGKYGADGWATVDIDRIDPGTFTRLLGIAHGTVVSGAKPARKARSPKG